MQIVQTVKSQREVVHNFDCEIFFPVRKNNKSFNNYFSQDCGTEGRPLILHHPLCAAAGEGAEGTAAAATAAAAAATAAPWQQLQEVRDDLRQEIFHDAASASGAELKAQ